MSAQSGFLNCFLKFIQGERGEKLQNDITPGRSASSRFTITMDERNAILTASSKRLNQDNKKQEPVPEKRVRKRGRPKVATRKRASRSMRSKGSVSEADSESGGTEASESRVDNQERLCLKGDSNDGDECTSSDQKSDDQKSDEQKADDQKADEQISEEIQCGEEEGAKVIVDRQIVVSAGENGKILRDRRKTRGSVESNDKTVFLSNPTETESAAPESSVIPNGEENRSEGKGGDSVESTPVPERKKRGKKRKSDPEDGVPRRTLSSRRAKQKSRISYAESGDEEDIPGLDDNSDSDDPVWVPDEKRGSSDEGSNFSWSKYEKLHMKAKRSGGNTSVMSPSKGKLEDSGVKQNPKENTGNTNSGGVVGSIGTLKGERAGEKGHLAIPPTPTLPASNGTSLVNVKVDVKNVTASSNPPVKPQPEVKTDPFSPALIGMPFQSGTFIAQKTDLEEKEEPPIWRVDGKSLLQKYEPFKAENGKTWYRNVSTYSGWGPKSHLKYHELPVKFIKQNRVETIVEIIQAELTINEDKLCEKIMKEYEKHAYAYEVFVQTLASHALDSNFLSEIIAEKDDYFLNCVEEIDKVCGEKKNRLMEACQWPKKLTESLVTWPMMTLSQSELLPKNQCSVCYVNQAVTHVKMDGNPYKFSTLEYEPPSEESFKSKEFSICINCSEILTIFHRIVHLKYHTYENGVKLVLDKKTLDPSKNNTDILHDILADEPRVKKEFQEVSRMWAQAEIKSKRVKRVDEKKVITIK